MRVSRHRQLSSGESKEKNDMTKEEMEEYGVRLIDYVLTISTFTSIIALIFKTAKPTRQ